MSELKLGMKLGTGQSLLLLLPEEPAGARDKAPLPSPSSRFCTLAALDFKLKSSGTGIQEQAQESAKMERRYIKEYHLLLVHRSLVSNHQHHSAGSRWSLLPQTDPDVR